MKALKGILVMMNNILRYLIELLTFKGRIGWVRFLISAVFILFLFIFILTLLFVSEGYKHGWPPPSDLPPEPLITGSAVLLCGIVIWFVLSAVFNVVKRLHDMNKSALVLFLFVLLLVIIGGFLYYVNEIAFSFYYNSGSSYMIIAFFAYLLLKAGTKGANKYGEPPKW